MRDVKRKAVGGQTIAEGSLDVPPEAEKCDSRRADRRWRKRCADLERRKALADRERRRGAPRGYQLVPNACEACRGTGSRCEMLHSLSDSVCARCYHRQLGCVFPQQEPSPDHGDAAHTAPDQVTEGSARPPHAAPSRAEQPSFQQAPATPAPASSASAWPGPSYPQPQRLVAPMPHVSPHGWVSFGSYPNPLFGGTDPGTPLNLVNGVEVLREPLEKLPPGQQPD